MNCKNAQDLILGEYIDGNIGSELQKELKNHIAACAECRELEAAIIQNAVRPFRQAEKAKAPQAIWEGIKDRIQKEYAPKSPVDVFFGLREALGYLFYVRKPAFAIATAAAIVIAVMVFLKSPTQADVYLNDQAAFMAGLGNGGGNNSDFDPASILEDYSL